MKQILFVPFLAALGFAAACGGGTVEIDDETPDGSSSGSPSSSSGDQGGSSSGGNGSSSGGSSSGGVEECIDAPFAFPADTTTPLAAGDYQQYLTIDDEFPFDVVGLYSSTSDLIAPSWGEHGGLLVPENDDGDFVLHRFATPTTATGALSETDTVTLPRPADLFTPSFPAYIPAVSLPGNHYLTTYTTTPVEGIAAGRAFLYANETLAGSAWSNGIFDGKGWSRGADVRIAYHTFSPFEAQQSNGDTSGVYVHDTCNGALFGPGCAAGFPLFETPGDSSGPVAKDASGSLMVATFGTLVSLRAASRCGVLDATGPSAVEAFHSFSAAGTQAFAVIPPTATLPGYVVHRSYANALHATPFTRSGEAFETAGNDLDAPFAFGPDGGGDLTFFNDDKGYLWVVLNDTDDGPRVLKLRRRSQ